MLTCICPGSRYALRSKIRTAFRIEVNFKFDLIERKICFFRVIYAMIVLFQHVVHVVHQFNCSANFIIKVFNTLFHSHIYSNEYIIFNQSNREGKKINFVGVYFIFMYRIQNKGNRK
jgi:hypothetical protein